MLLFLARPISSFLRLPRHRPLSPSSSSSSNKENFRFFQNQSGGIKPKKWQHHSIENPQEDAKSDGRCPQVMLYSSSRQQAAVIVLSKMILRKWKLFSTTTVSTAISTTLSPARTTTASSSALRGGGAFVTALLLRGGGSAVAAAAAPKLVTWIGPALACASSYACYNLFIKKASSGIDPILGGVLLQFVAALIGTALLLLKTAGGASSSSSLSMTKSGLIWSIAAGVAVGAAEILSFIISGMGVEATQSIPILIGGSIVIGTILGAVWLQERLTLRGWLGILLIALGITLVGIDPGSSMGH